MGFKIQRIVSYRCYDFKIGYTYYGERSQKAGHDHEHIEWHIPPWAATPHRFTGSAGHCWPVRVPSQDRAERNDETVAVTTHQDPPSLGGTESESGVCDNHPTREGYGGQEDDLRQSREGHDDPLDLTDGELNEGGAHDVRHAREEGPGQRHKEVHATEAEEQEVEAVPCLVSQQEEDQDPVHQNRDQADQKIDSSIEIGQPKVHLRMVYSCMFVTS